MAWSIYSCKQEVLNSIPGIQATSALVLIPPDYWANSQEEGGYRGKLVASHKSQTYPGLILGITGGPLRNARGEF